MNELTNFDMPLFSVKQLKGMNKAKEIISKFIITRQKRAIINGTNRIEIIMEGEKNKCETIMG